MTEGNSLSRKRRKQPCHLQEKGEGKRGSSGQNKTKKSVICFQAYARKRKNVENRKKKE